MHSDTRYASFANFSPKGISDLSRKSKRICGAIKTGDKRPLTSMIKYLQEDDVLLHFFDGSVLVPVPRSSVTTKGALWPSEIICQELVSNGIGVGVEPILKRNTAIRKSATSTGNRPTIHEHFETLEISAGLLSPQKITLVDDVITLGATSMACASRVREAFPDTEISIFAVMRTQGFKPNIEKLRDPSVGVIKYFPSGKIFREP